MLVNRYVFLLLLLSCGLAPPWCQAELKVDAPESVQANTVVLVTIDSEAKFIQLRVRRTLFDMIDAYELVTDAGRRFGFTGPPGKYAVEVTTFDPEQGIESETLAITIAAADCDDRSPEDPEDPPAPPDIQWQETLRRQSMEAARSVNDPTTASQLSVALDRAVPTVRTAVDLQTARNIVSQEIETVMRNRTGESLHRDWLNLFRRPLDAALGQLISAQTIRTPDDYADAIRAIAAGVKGEPG